jgi:hypothetical protein
MRNRYTLEADERPMLRYVIELLSGIPVPGEPCGISAISIDI